MTTGADSALQDALKTVTRLHKMCCEPNRSPRMEQLTSTITRAGDLIDGGGVEGDRLDDVVSLLEEAGSQVGWLQVSCCAEARMPLYQRVLEDLQTAQLSLKRAVGLGH